MATDFDDNSPKSLTTSLDLDVKIMAAEVADMQEKMKVIEDTLGVAATTEKKEKTSLQQTANERQDDLQARMNLLEKNVADLLSRTTVVEKEVGVVEVAQVSWLEVTKGPAMGLANRAVAA